MVFHIKTWFFTWKTWNFIEKPGFSLKTQVGKSWKQWFQQILCSKPGFQQPFFQEFEFSAVHFARIWTFSVHFFRNLKFQLASCQKHVFFLLKFTPPESPSKKTSRKHKVSTPRAEPLKALPWDLCFEPWDPGSWILPPPSPEPTTPTLKHQTLEPWTLNPQPQTLKPYTLKP